MGPTAARALHQRPAGQRADPEGGRRHAGGDPTASTTSARGLVDTATIAACTTLSPGLEAEVAALERLWDARRAARAARDEPAPPWSAPRAGRLSAARLRRAEGARPAEGEEAALAERRTTMMQGEKIAEDLARRRPRSGPAVAGGLARRRRCAGWSARARQRAGADRAAVKAMDAAINALEEADQSISTPRSPPPTLNPHELERIEERLSRCAAPRANMRRRWKGWRRWPALCRGGGADRRRPDRLTELEKAVAARRQGLRRRGEQAVGGAVKAAEKLAKAGNAELAPLKLERAKFSTQIEADARRAGPAGLRPRRVLGADQSGHPAGPLMKVASGGELSRFLLALKVVLSDKGSARRLVCSTRSTPGWAARWPTPSARGWRGSPRRCR